MVAAYWAQARSPPLPRPLTASQSSAAAGSDEWRLDDVKARRSFTGQSELSSGVSSDGGSSYVLLYTRDAAKQPFSVHPCDFVVMREQANYHVLSLEEAEQRMKQRAKRFDKKMNALPTLVRLEGERQMEQRIQDAAANDTAAGGGGGSGSGGGLPGTTGDDGQQGVQIRRKVTVGVSVDDDDEAGGRDDTAVASTAAGEEDDDDPFNSADSTGRGRGRKGGKLLKRDNSDKEAGIDYRDEFDDDDETHEDKSALADGNEHDDEEQINVDEQTIESEDEEENEAAKKRTESLIQQAEDELNKQSNTDSEAAERGEGRKKAKQDSNLDSDLESDDEAEVEEEADTTEADDSEVDDEEMDDVEDSELDISSDSEDGHGSTLPAAAGTVSAGLAAQVSVSAGRSTDGREKKRSRMSSEAEVAGAADGMETGGEAASKKLKASPAAATATASQSAVGGAELDDSLVRSAFLSHPRATIQELTKRLTRATYPQPIDKARLIAILRRVCELDPNTKQLTLKHDAAAEAISAAPVAVTTTAAATAHSGDSNG